MVCLADSVLESEPSLLGGERLSKLRFQRQRPISAGRNHRRIFQQSRPNLAFPSFRPASQVPLNGSNLVR